LIDAGLKAPSSTWTYLINDNTFEDMLGLEFIGNTGLQVGATVDLSGLAPLATMLFPLVRKLRRKKKRQS